jgi:pimeloyl-ACP methyl ester carboxylesterase
MSGMTFVLIPGAGGSAWYWHRVEAELRRRGHDAVAVDLSADDERAGLAEYTEAVVDAIGDRSNVVLVAQSLAGFTAPLVCERVPVSLLVLVNAMIPRSGESAGDWWAGTGHAQAMRENDEREGRMPGAAPGDPGFDETTYFLHDVPRDVVEEGRAHARPQSGGPFGQPWPLEAWPDVPTRVLTGRDDRFFPAEFQRRVAEERLGITPDEMPGGHLVALAHPEELTDRLLAYAAQLEGARSR